MIKSLGFAKNYASRSETTPFFVVVHLFCGLFFMASPTVYKGFNGPEACALREAHVEPHDVI